MMILGIGNKNCVQKGTRAFTLIEILLVVVLMAVITSIAVANFQGSLRGLKLKAVVGKLTDYMRYAQSRSITQIRPMRLVFDEQLRTFWLTESQRESGLFENGEDLIFTKLENRWGKIEKIDSDISIDFDGSYMKFFSDGKIKGSDIVVCLKKTQKNNEQECLIISCKQQGFINVLVEEK